MKLLILFSGTGSMEKVIPEGNDVRGLDLSNKYKPYYNKDILTWDYKPELSNWIPDFIHSSFVCCKVSRILMKDKQDHQTTFLLIDKTLEIINYVKHLNPKLKFTIENPKTRTTLDYEPLTRINHLITSYCKYGFGYQKDTTFWYGGFDLKLLSQCIKNKRCKCFNHGHPVRVGVSRNSKTHFLSKNQITDTEHFRELKKLPEYKGFSYQDFRFRIPEGICNEIITQIIKK